MKSCLRLALYQPDMAANAGAVMRLCACLGIGLDIIEPCGFVFDDRKLKRVAMDYALQSAYVRHASWQEFQEQVGSRRIILLTTKAALPYHQFTFKQDDVLLLGRESAGVPEDVHAAADARLIVPMQPGLRSLNVGMAASMVIGEAIRQNLGKSS